jgi:hypothetical protein
MWRARHAVRAGARQKTGATGPAAQQNIGCLLN